MKQVRELAVPKGNVRVSVGQGEHDVSERAQALVDALRLLETRSLGARPRQPLASREVHEVERAVHRLTGRVDAVQVQREHHVRTARVLVHVRLGGGPYRLRLLHELGHLPGVGHLHRLETGHGGAAVGVVLHVVLGLRGDLLRHQQILDVLVVNLNHGGADRERRRGHASVLLSSLHRGVPRLEDLLDGPRNQTAVVVEVEILALILRFAGFPARVAAEHRVRLSRPRLAVGEYANLVPVQRRLHEVRDLLEHLALPAVLAEHAVKVKVESLGAAGGRNLHPSPRHLAHRVNLQQRLVHVLTAAHLVRPRVLVVRGRADAAEHADVPLQFLHRVVQRAPDDGRLPQLSLALRQEPLELVQPRLVVPRRLLALVEAGGGGGGLGDGVAELGPRRRQRVALLVVLLPEHLQPFL